MAALDFIISYFVLDRIVLFKNRLRLISFFGGNVFDVVEKYSSKIKKIVSSLY